jgi:hypothetical protein
VTKEIIVTSTTAPDTVPVRRTIVNRIGLILAGLLAIAQIVTALGQLDSPVLSGGLIAVAVVSLVAIVFAWRGSSQARAVVAVATVLTALSGLPAFFVSGVPAGAVVAAAVGILLSLAVAGLVLARPRLTR